MELRDKINKIFAQNGNGEAIDLIVALFSDKWISVDDRLPKDDWFEQWGYEAECIIDNVIVYFDDGEDPKVSFAQYSARDGWCYIDGQPHTFWGDKITHWMLFPEPPK